MSKPLIPTSFNPSIENRELAIETEANNARYKEECKAATPEKTQQMKEEMWDIFWKDFDPEECLYDNSQELMDWENPDDVLSLLDNSEPAGNNKDTTWEPDILNEKVKLDLWKTIDTKYWPLVKELYVNWLINYEIAIDLIQKIDENPKSKLDFTGYNLDNDTLTRIESIYIQLDSPTVQNPDFSKDIVDIEEFNEIRESKESWDLSWFNSDIYDMLSWYYVDFSSISTSWEKDVVKNLELAIKSAKWELIENHKTLNKDTDKFKETVKMINSWNLKEMLYWIKRLLALCYNSAWRLWKIDERFRKVRKEKELTQKKLGILNQQLHDKKLDLEHEQNESNKKKIEQEINELKENISLKKWDLDCLWWWEDDVISDWLDNQKENS